MLGDTRRSRVGVLIVAVSASTIATGAIIATCLERGLEHHARMSAALSSLRPSEDDAANEANETGTVTTTAAELDARGATNAAATTQPERANGGGPERDAPSTDADDARDRQEAQPSAPEVLSPAAPTEAAPFDDARAMRTMIDTLDRTVTTLERIDEVQRQSEAEAEDAEREARATYDAEEREAREPSEEERSTQARRTAQVVAGTPMVQPRFEDIGAGAFSTEPPLWGASAWTPNPSAGAGPFTTETIVSPNIVYFGVPQSPGTMPQSPGALVVQPAP